MPRPRTGVRCLVRIRRNGAPDAEPAIKMGIMTLTLAALDLMAKAK